MLPGGESFEVAILPSAMMDIVRGRYFYDQFGYGRARCDCLARSGSEV